MEPSMSNKPKNISVRKPRTESKRSLSVTPVKNVSDVSTSFISGFTSEKDSKDLMSAGAVVVVDERIPTLNLILRKSVTRDKLQIQHIKRDASCQTYCQREMHRIAKKINDK